MSSPYMTIMSEEKAERVAVVIGPLSACARALKELRFRRENGEDVHLWQAGNSVLVGPDPSSTASTADPDREGRERT